VTDPTETVRVELGERSYGIEIGIGNIDETGPFLVSLGDVSHAIVITDNNVQDPHALNVAESLGRESLKVDIIAVEPGEPTKSVDMAAGLWQGLLDLGADRKTVVVAVGGGVVGDLAGFIAATFARGLRFLQVPTSLLAQVDSSVGGKVGVNLPTAKNMVGAFLQPIGVLIDTATLDTLPEREFVSGLGEAIKYGVSLDADLFELFENNIDRLLKRDHGLLVDITSQCCRLKADIVRQDEREETGLRAVLNYGHTFGHAFESLAGYGQILHGEGVAIGMVCASRLAQRLGRLDLQCTARQVDLLRALGLPVDVPELETDAIMEAMMHDKKVAHGKLRFVLPTKIGHVELVGDVDPEDVKAALR
jgi:3-dehydroquinate synthase